MPSQSPPHLHRAVHFDDEVLHLQCPLHPISVLHPQEMSSRQIAEAFSMVIH